MKKLILVAAISSAYFLPTLAYAESTSVAGPSTSANLDFRIVIPVVLQLRIGAVGAGTANINLLTFSPPVATLGDGTAAAATGGDATASSVNVRLVSNNASANVTLQSTTTSLNNGAPGETIPWSQIVVTPTGGAPTHPTFNPTGGAGTLQSFTGTNRVVNLSGTWSYSYLNTIVPASGAYGASLQGQALTLNGGRVVYTAVQL